MLGEHPQALQLLTQDSETSTSGDLEATSGKYPLGKIQVYLTQT